MVSSVEVLRDALQAKPDADQHDRRCSEHHREVHAHGAQGDDDPSERDPYRDIRPNAY